MFHGPHKKKNSMLKLDIALIANAGKCQGTLHHNHALQTNVKSKCQACNCQYSHIIYEFVVFPSNNPRPMFCKHKKRSQCLPRIKLILLKCSSTPNSFDNMFTIKNFILSLMKTQASAYTKWGQHRPFFGDRKFANKVVIRDIQAIPLDK